MPTAVGIVCDEGRGSLPYALIHGEALVAVAAWSLERAEVEMVDQGVPWSNVVAHGTSVVLHDPLCPMTPPDFIATCVAEATERDAVVVGVRPVTDTVKELDEDEVDVGATVDRDDLWAVCSPVVLPAAVVADLGDAPSTSDFVELVAVLRERYDTQMLVAPAAARRVASAEDLRVLAALTGSDQAADVE